MTESFRHAHVSAVSREGLRALSDGLDIPPFLDRRHELTQKGKPVTDPKKKREPKPKKVTFRLVLECAHAQFNMAAFETIVSQAKEHGTIKSAKLSGLPTTTDLA